MNNDVFGMLGRRITATTFRIKLGDWIAAVLGGGTFFEITWRGQPRMLLIPWSEEWNQRCIAERLMYDDPSYEDRPPRPSDYPPAPPPPVKKRPRFRRSRIRDPWTSMFPRAKMGRRR